jgi:hypothetical protein
MPLDSNLFDYGGGPVLLAHELVLKSSRDTAIVVPIAEVVGVERRPLVTRRL